MSNYTSFTSVRAGSGASKRTNSNDRYVYSRFYAPINYWLKTPTATKDQIPSVADAAINILRDAEGNQFEIRLEQAYAGAVPQVAAHANGVDLGVDAADNDGISMDLGYGAAGAEVAHTRGAFIIGTDAAFFLRVKLDIADVSDSDQIAVGFVKGGWPVDGLLDTYTDYAALNVDNGDIKIENRTNSGTASVTDTTQDVADAGTITLEVRVSSTGAVKFLVDGAAPTVDVTGFSFDDGDTVNAILTTLNDIAGDPGVVVREWESGFISSRGLTGIQDLAEAAQAD